MPGVLVDVNFQSVAALSASVPLGRRASEPGAVPESAVASGKNMPSTRSVGAGKPMIIAITGIALAS